MNIAILGANGRMGKALLDVVNEDQQVRLSAACVRANSTYYQQPIAQSSLHYTTINEALSEDVDVVIDFTLPDALQGHLQQCVEANKPVVVGTTGLLSQQSAALVAAAQQIPVVFAANYSVGVTLMTKLSRMAASALGDTADIEIIEAHHRHKRDAPSGTAKAIGEAIADELQIDLEQHAIYGREGDTGERDQKTIGFSTIRGGDIIGEHTVLFADNGERLEITHRASSRQTFALGAVRAAKWVVGKTPGLYDLEDVLGIK
ncbi:4-hydroxy-tetrahydrodipicolinate reductase [Alteromonas flava]|uniref:4-hydroxy-tetrahydrodipicolinate reductase n=1 Tax=Alteromonas flava TaxID=2048003 RepID=UPI000C291DEC|nr:4-hydroxy-tetrahydrodipicolinate reductase [Alteromonas flava]